MLNLGEGEEAVVCSVVPEDADHIAAIGENRKLLVFPIADVPEMARGRGVILQKFHDGGLSDVCTFVLADGLVFAAGERTRTMTELDLWLGERAQAGRMPPHGVGRDKKFA